MNRGRQENKHFFKDNNYTMFLLVHDTLAVLIFENTNKSAKSTVELSFLAGSQGRNKTLWNILSFF